MSLASQGGSLSNWKIREFRTDDHRHQGLDNPTTDRAQNAMTCADEAQSLAPSVVLRCPTTVLPHS